MTIRGFWGEFAERMKKNGGTIENYRLAFPNYIHKFYNENGRFLTVGIDIFQWMSELSTGGTIKGGNSSKIQNFPDSDHAILIVTSGIASKLRELMKLPINFVIVFDGSEKQQKKRWDTTSKQNSNIDNRFEARYAESLQRIRRGEHKMNGKCVKAVIDLLKAWNISYIFAPGDAEIELARLNNAGIVDAIISNDSDSLAYGAKVILKNYSKFRNDLPPSASKNGEKDNVVKYVTVIDERLLNDINLNADKIMFIACFCGDDYSDGIDKLGIKKTWDLATSNKGDFDVVKGFKDIYVDQDVNNYIQGKLPYNYEQRLELLTKYKTTLGLYIQMYRKEIFGQNYYIDLILPDDFIIANHYYPHFSPLLFESNSFANNINNFNGNLCTKIILPILPQPLSVEQIGTDEIIIKRGNDLLNNTRLEQFFNFKSTGRAVISSEDSRDWFFKLNYDLILKYTQLARNSMKGVNHLVKIFGGFCLWKAIINMDKFEYTFEDIFISSEKKKETEEGYQVKFKPYQILKKFYDLPDVLMDENLNIIEEQPIHLWLPAYMFDLENNGRRLVEHYKKGKMPPSRSQKGTPRKKKTPTQTTTLDTLSASPNSPYKMHSVKHENLLLNQAAKFETILKRDISDIDSSPEVSPKKMMKMEQNTDFDHILPNNSILFEALEEDNEVSRILESTDYVGESLRDDSKDNFHDFFTNSYQSENRNSLETSENKGNIGPEFSMKKNTFSKIIKTAERQNKEHNSVSRGPSLLDSLTKLPTVPKEPFFNHQYELKQENGKFYSARHNSFDSTFSSNGSIKIISFDDNVRKSERIKSGTDSTNLSKLDDTFESNGSMDIIFFGDPTYISKHKNNISNEVIELENVCNMSKENHFYTDADTSICNVEITGNSNIRENTKISGKNKEIYESTDAEILSDIRIFPHNIINSKRENNDNDTISIPSDFDGSGILLAENTDDDDIWIIPEKKDKNRKKR
jgi:5'-3' exonuclease